ncbi:hypothetical protein GEMRC1_002035 [Eukaryota sp. GEM-RC1]
MFKRIQPGGLYSSDDEAESDTNINTPHCESQDEDVSYASSTDNSENEDLQITEDKLEEMSETELFELLDKQGLLQEYMASLEQEDEEDCEDESQETSETDDVDKWPKKCDACPDKVLLNQQQLDDHVKSKIHKKNLRKFKRSEISTEELVKKMERNSRKKQRRAERNKHTNDVKKVSLQ